MTLRHLDRLLHPASVAVYGASDRPGSLGTAVWRNLRAAGFQGALWPLNPKHSTLDGVHVHARTAQLPAAPDLAVICTPPATVARLVGELGERGTRAVIVLGGGLDGRQKQAMLDAARPHLVRLLGPNCIGLLSPEIGLNASFAHVDTLPGPLAFVSQSGSLITAVLDWARTRGIGFSHLVSLGDQADVDFGDLLDYLANDPKTRAILLYAESIVAPRKFMSAARAAARNKPVIIVKAGRTARGAHAASLHTGAPAGADAVCDAAFRRAGLLRVETLADLFIAAQTLARLDREASPRLTVIGNGGGAGVLAADAADRHGIVLAEPAPALRAQIEPLLPRGGSVANPIDLVGDAPLERYTAALAPLLADPTAGSVLFVHAPTGVVHSDDVARALLPLVRPASARVLACWLGSSAAAPARALFAEAGIADYETPEDAVRAFALLQTYRRNQAALLETPAASENAPPDLPAAHAVVTVALAAGRTRLQPAEARALLAAFGIVLAPARDATPCLGALHVGARVDPSFGPVLTCREHGEAPADAVVGLPPLNRSLAHELVTRSRIGRRLDGQLPAPAADALHDLLIALAQMLAELPHLAALEIAPLRLHAHRGQAQAAQVRIAAEPVAGAERFAVRPYPAQWVSQLAWRDRQLTIRPIRAEDEAQHRDFLRSLDPEDLRLRVFHSRRELPHSELARLTQIDYEREIAFIAEDQGQTLGVVRAAVDPDNVEAEFGIIVRSELKGCGLGRVLMQRLIEHLRARGTQRLMGQVLRENLGMRHMAAAFGLHADAARAEPGVECWVLELSPKPSGATRR